MVALQVWVYIRPTYSPSRPRTEQLNRADPATIPTVEVQPGMVVPGVRDATTRTIEATNMRTPPINPEIGREAQREKGEAGHRVDGQGEHLEERVLRRARGPLSRR